MQSKYMPHVTEEPERGQRPVATEGGAGCTQYLYEYAVIRYVPRVEREEFVNVGLVMMCKRRRWLRVRLHVCEERLKALFPKCDIEGLRRQLTGFERVAGGCAGPIGTLEAHERFRWLTAVRSASLTTSRPHPGLTDNLQASFDRLFADLVAE